MINPVKPNISLWIS